VRVRQWAVVGAAFVAAWAGGAGIASATPTETTDGGCQLPPLLLTSETEDLPINPEPCGVDVWVAVDGDCENPETFTFNIDAEGLEPGGEYGLLAYSDDIVGADGEPTGFRFVFDADEAGDASESFPVTESADFQAPSAGFTVQYEVVTDLEADEPTPVAGGSYELEACETETPTTTPVTTHPTEQPVESAHPTTSAPATTTPAAAPVAIHPAAQQPVLANTGTPTAAIALVGGGLLVAGGGALVATRRRA